MKELNRLLQLGILIIIAVVLSCKKDSLSDTTCNVSNPLEQLPWLKTTIQALDSFPDREKYYIISMAKYNGGTVFLEGYCDPSANYVIPVLNCSGERIGILGFGIPGEGVIDQGSLTNIKVIWKSENSECGTN